MTAGADPIGGALPSLWRSTTLGQLCDEFGGEVQTGPFGSQLHAADYVADGVPSVMPKDIIGDHISADSIARVPEEDAARLAVHRLRAGDIVYARRGDIGRRALVTEQEEGWLCGTGCLRIRTNAPSVLPAYMLAYLGHPAVRSWVESKAQGATMLNLNTTILRSLPLRVPPIAEQHRIAVILNTADVVRRKRREAIALTDELLRSAFLEMFGDPVTNPKRWPVKPLATTIERFEAGWSANGEARIRTGDEYGVLKVSAVTSGYFRPKEHKAVAAADVTRELVSPRRGDLLFSRANTRDLVAACCLVERDEPRLFLPDKLWRIVADGRMATPEYLKFLLGHERFRHELTKRATGTSGSMLNISMEKVRSMEIPAPPIALQKRFSSQVWKTYALRERLAEACTVADALFGTLVQRAFRGDLTPRTEQAAARVSRGARAQSDTPSFLP